MTAVAANADATTDASPYAAAHVVLVENGGATHEHCNDDDVDGEVVPCETGAGDVNAVVHIKAHFPLETRRLHQHTWSRNRSRRLHQ